MQGTAAAYVTDSSDDDKDTRPPSILIDTTALNADTRKAAMMTSLSSEDSNRTIRADGVDSVNLHANGTTNMNFSVSAYANLDVNEGVGSLPLRKSLCLHMSTHQSSADYETILYEDAGFTESESDSDSEEGETKEINTNEKASQSVVVPASTTSRILSAPNLRSDGYSDVVVQAAAAATAPQKTLLAEHGTRTAVGVVATTLDTRTSLHSSAVERGYVDNISDAGSLVGSSDIQANREPVADSKPSSNRLDDRPNIRIATKDESLVRDWNAAFQEIVDRHSGAARQLPRSAAKGSEDSSTVTRPQSQLEGVFGEAISPGVDELEVARARALRELVDEFVAASEAVVRVLVRERSLPADSPLRTFRAVDVGGIAGGTKFIACGILFKFATNLFFGNQTQINDQSDMWLYPSVGCAMKAVNAELRGVMSLMGCRVPLLHFPLIAICDYAGYRVLCSSLIPIQGLSTLVFGSADGGRGFSDKHAPLTEALSICGRALNLRPHLFQQTCRDKSCPDRRDDAEPHAHEYTIPLCVDLEGHLGTDGRVYCLDTARIFPPTPPLLPVRGRVKQRQFLFRHFRAEFMTRYCQNMPLSSDALSSFGRIDSQRDRTDVAHAFRLMREQAIPSFALELRTDDMRLRNGGASVPRDYSSSLAVTDVSVNDRGLLANAGRGFVAHQVYAARMAMQRLQQDCHRRGINYRYLGLVRMQLDQGSLRGPMWASPDPSLRFGGPRTPRDDDQLSKKDTMAMSLFSDQADASQVGLDLGSVDGTAAGNVTYNSRMLLAVMIYRCLMWRARERMRGATEELSQPDDPASWQRIMRRQVSSFLNTILDPDTDLWNRSAISDISSKNDDRKQELLSPADRSDFFPGVKYMLFDEQWSGALRIEEADPACCLRQLLGPILIRAVVDQVLISVGARVSDAALSRACAAAFSKAADSSQSNWHVHAEDVSEDFAASFKKMDFVLQEEAEALMRASFATSGSQEGEAKIREALALLETSLAIRPGDAASLTNYAKALSEYAQFNSHSSSGRSYVTAADGMLRSAIKVSPAYIPALLEWATLQLRIGTVSFSTVALPFGQKAAHVRACAEALELVLGIFQAVAAGLPLTLAVQGVTLPDLESLQLRHVKAAELSRYGSGPIDKDPGKEREAETAAQVAFDTGPMARATVLQRLGTAVLALARIEMARRTRLFEYNQVWQQQSNVSEGTGVGAALSNKFKRLTSSSKRQVRGVQQPESEAHAALLSPSINNDIKNARNGAYPVAVPLPEPFGSPNGSIFSACSGSATSFSFIHSVESSGMAAMLGRASTSCLTLLNSAAVRFKEALSLAFPLLASAVVQISNYAAATQKKLIAAGSVVDAQSAVAVGSPPVLLSLLSDFIDKDAEAKNWADRRVRQEAEVTEYEGLQSLLLMRATTATVGLDVTQLAEARVSIIGWAETLADIACEIWSSAGGSTHSSPYPLMWKDAEPAAPSRRKSFREAFGQLPIERSEWETEHSHLFAIAEFCYRSSSIGAAAAVACFRESEALFELAISLCKLRLGAAYKRMEMLDAVSALLPLQAWGKSIDNMRACGVHPSSSKHARGRFFNDPLHATFAAIDRKPRDSDADNGDEMLTMASATETTVGEAAVNLAAAHIVPVSLFERHSYMLGLVLRLLAKGSLVLEVGYLVENMGNSGESASETKKWTLFARFVKIVEFSAQMGDVSSPDDVPSRTIVVQHDCAAAIMAPLVDRVLYSFDGQTTAVAHVPPFKMVRTGLIRLRAVATIYLSRLLPRDGDHSPPDGIACPIPLKLGSTARSRLFAIDLADGRLTRLKRSNTGSLKVAS